MYSQFGKDCKPQFSAPGLLSHHTKSRSFWRSFRTSRSFSSTRDSRTLSVSNICSSIFSISVSSTFCCSSSSKGPFTCTKHSKLKALELFLSCPSIAKLSFPPFCGKWGSLQKILLKGSTFFNVLHEVRYQEQLGNQCFALVHNGSSFITGCRQVIQEF